MGLDLKFLGTEHVVDLFLVDLDDLEHDFKGQVGNLFVFARLGLAGPAVEECGQNTLTGSFTQTRYFLENARENLLGQSIESVCLSAPSCSVRHQDNVCPIDDL